MSRNALRIRIGLVIAVMAALALAGTVVAQGGTVVKVDPAASTAQVNDTVNVAIKVDNVANLTAAELHLSFNPTVLEVMQLSNGGFVVADFTAQNTFDNAAGTIDYAVAQINRPPANGSGALLNITFRAKANGVSPVNFRGTQAAPTGVILADPNGMPIPAALANGSVNVGNVPITPQPTVQPTAQPTGQPTQPPGATATPGPTATPAPGPYPILGTHVVRYGESLFCIGRAYKVSPWSIAQVNAVPWPYTIFPNQQLRIPNAPWYNIPPGPVCQPQFPVPTPPTVTPPGPVPTIAPPPTLVPPPGCRAVYVVRPGDTLYSIATRYGTTVWAIARVNYIWNVNLIYPGQSLCIP
jgi:LysM repeat protein